MGTIIDRINEMVEDIENFKPTDVESLVKANVLLSAMLSGGKPLVYTEDVKLYKKRFKLITGRDLYLTPMVHKGFYEGSLTANK